MIKNNFDKKLFLWKKKVTLLSQVESEIIEYILSFIQLK